MTPPQLEPEFRLAAMTPKRRRVGTTIAIGALGAVALLLAAGLAFVLLRNDTPTTAAASGLAGAPTTSPAPPPDAEENAREACARLAAVGDDLEALHALGEQAAASGIVGIGGNGALLSEKTLDAMAAAGSSEEAGKIADVKQRVVALRRACIAAGFRAG